jgi:anti-sigma B factor antagonist
MKYNSDKSEKYTLFQVQENKIDASFSSELKNCFSKTCEEGETNMILDLTEVKYVDSSGLSAILVGNRLFREQKGDFVIVGISEHVMKLVKISQLDKILTILPTIQEGIDHIFMSELEKEMGEDTV